MMKSILENALIVGFGAYIYFRRTFAEYDYSNIIIFYDENNSENSECNNV